MFKPKVGREVMVCYDGKLGRAVSGTVIKTKRNRIKVAFVEWGEPDNQLEAWFYRLNNNAFGGWVKVDNSLMQAMFETPGDWYSVYKHKN